MPTATATAPAALALAAEAVCGALLVDPMLRAAGEASPSGPGLPNGSKAVVAGLVGGRGGGRIAIAVSPELAEVLADGPLGRQSLDAALEPVIASALIALETEVGGPLRADAPHVVDAVVALGPSVDHPDAVQIPLHAGDDHVATIWLSWSDEGAADDRAAPVELPPLGEGAPLLGTNHPLELLHDVEMSVTAELGRTRMSVRNLLSLTPGAIVELDRAAGSPVDLLVNGTLIARGEVVVVDDEYGVRITEIVRRDGRR